MYGTLSGDTTLVFSLFSSLFRVLLTWIFLEKEHIAFVTKNYNESEKKEKKEYAIAVVLKNPTKEKHLLTIFTKKGVTLYPLPQETQITKHSDLVKHFQKSIVSKTHPELVEKGKSVGKNWHHVERQEFPFDMLSIDPQFGVSTCVRIGVVLALEGQTKEEEFFENIPTPEFTEFLNVMGSLIEMKGWSGYRGDLSDDQSTYFTKWRDFEVIFHICPFLTPEQQRRLVGNDKVLIYFQQTPFPARFRGSVNSLAITVQPTPRGTYNLGGFMVNSINMQGCYIPKEEVPRKLLKDILLFTCINGITACINSPPLSTFATQVRERHLAEVVDFYV